jgi:hypothetical protein
MLVSQVCQMVIRFNLLGDLVVVGHLAATHVVLDLHRFHLRHCKHCEILIPIELIEDVFKVFLDNRTAVDSDSVLGPSHKI